MNKENLYGSTELSELEDSAKKEAASVTVSQKWLLLGALLIGLTFHQAFFKADVAWISCAWVCYGAVFLIFNWQRAKARPFSFIFLACALYLSVIMVLQDHGYSDFTLVILNILAVPCLLMAHAQIVSRPLPSRQESYYIILFILGFFIQPFVYIGRFFAALISLFKKKSSTAFIAALVTIPLAAIVLSLLLQADAVMGLLAYKLLSNFRISEIILRFVLTTIIAVLFYSFLYGVTWDNEKESYYKLPQKWTPSVPRIVLGTLLAIYAVFTAFQFVYLFGGHGLPQGLTYAEYAREGFAQLLWVAIINLSVFATCLCRVSDDKPLRVMLVMLLFASAVILASSFTRLSLYTQAYGLTFKRIQAYWLLIYLTATFILCGVRVYKKNFPLLVVCAVSFALWYVALNIPNLTAWYA